jgi:hypothetical protein
LQGAHVRAADLDGVLEVYVRVLHLDDLDENRS